MPAGRSVKGPFTDSEAVKGPFTASGFGRVGARQGWTETIRSHKTEDYSFRGKIIESAIESVGRGPRSCSSRRKSESISWGITLPRRFAQRRFHATAGVAIPSVTGDRPEEWSGREQGYRKTRTFPRRHSAPSLASRGRNAASCAVLPPGCSATSGAARPAPPGRLRSRRKRGTCQGTCRASSGWIRVRPQGVGKVGVEGPAQVRRAVKGPFTDPKPVGQPRLSLLITGPWPPLPGPWVRPVPVGGRPGPGGAG
ncbi:hypothetical protein ATK36_0212 [Amycolatopsis sulphurea]|uniref:Uncharacterized protein n=1 Tax=Amycolatopsis sulphurea TaxID=76022 RepID=A0A2A9G1G4_9PSEU|nr:hypothetical protein ATK36_0212 [Amycolatopsis sulphurea]